MQIDDSLVHEDQRIARALTRRYLIALIFVALLATMAWLSMELVIAEQRSTAVVVNVSGSQRMLSQRIALYASLLVKSRPQDRSAIRRKLEKAAERMRRGHLALLHGSSLLGLPRAMPDTIRRMYFSPPLALNRQVDAYLAHVNALLSTPDRQLTKQDPDLQAIISAGPNHLVASLDQVVYAYQRHGEAAIASILRAETFVWLLTLMLLGVEAAFIFRPISAQVKRVIARLEAMTQHLRRSNEELDQRVRERTAKLEMIAHFDPLTGIPNRRHFSDTLEEEIAQAQRNNTCLAVCYLDLDGFKPVNDLYGHEMGDQLLMTVARRIERVLRAGDILARLGGDEFALILSNIERREEVTEVLDRVLAAIREENRIDTITLQSSGSVGVTLFPADSADPETLLRHADQAMYQAKAAGKNRYHFFDPESDRQMQLYRERLQRLETAMQQDEFVLFYQPKANIRSGAVVGVEALIRWRHPQRGLLSPAEFLPIINGQPLAVRVGEWVLETAMRQIEAWKGVGLDLPVSVNIDAAHISQPDFVARLRRQLAQHPDVKDGDLELEVLESSALEDFDQVSQVMLACRKLGVHFALDDFGTGYSSLLYLKQLPVDTLKIDQSFIRGMLNDPDSMAILEGVLGLSTAFQRETIAEGVETVEHGEMLLRMDCEIAQGYAIAKPMPADNLRSWSLAWKPNPAWAAVRRISKYDLPALVALAEHRAWTQQLDAYLHGTYDVMPQLDHSQCRFGKWLAQKSESPSSRPLVRTLIPLHHHAHEMAKKLVEQKRRGQAGDVAEEMEEIYSVRDELVAQIIAFLDEQRTPLHQ